MWGQGQHLQCSEQGRFGLTAPAALIEIVISRVSKVKIPSSLTHSIRVVGVCVRRVRQTKAMLTILTRLRRSRLVRDMRLWLACLSIGLSILRLSIASGAHLTRCGQRWFAVGVLLLAAISALHALHCSRGSLDGSELVVERVHGGKEWMIVKEYDAHSALVFSSLVAARLSDQHDAQCAMSLNTHLASETHDVVYVCVDVQ